MSNKQRKHFFSDCKFVTKFASNCSKDVSASVVHGATDLQDHHDKQVQEETGAARGLPEDVSF